MADPSVALQLALVDRLEASLASLSCPVYDGAPLNAQMPYVSIDNEITNAADFLASRLDERLLYLSVWSDAKGQLEVKRIMAAIDEALHEQPLSISPGRVVSVRVLRKQSNREPDGVTYQGAVTLRIYTQH